MEAAWRLGVDSGGTFTDVCLSNGMGEIFIGKTPSTPDDPSKAIMQAIDRALEEAGLKASELAFLGHGTTVGTNALIEGKGAATGLITTEGFRDLLEIGRQQRPELYNLQAQKPPVLAPRGLREEVRERLQHTGAVETPLDEAGVRASVRRLKAKGVDALAICFLYSFVCSDHETRAAAIAAEECPELFISTSHAVVSEFREFERLSSTVVNAYLGPTLQRYIRRLSQRLIDRGVTVRPLLTQSNGGVVSFAAAEKFPVRSILSGPSTGVVAVEALARQIGANNLVTFDMGGTSTDVALLEGGLCALKSETVMHGYAIKAPMLDIDTVGAGGGSIACVDRGGLLKVGPASAGAVPGPACYGVGAKATVTDANVLMQTLNPQHLLGGRMKIRQDLSRAAVEDLAAQLGLSTMRTAEGILAVVTANMAKAVRVISVQRGHDLRDFALVAFGGAGPLHAARLARELAIKTVVIPRTPGALCALGLVTSRVRTSFSKSRVIALLPGAQSTLQSIFTALIDQAEQWFEQELIAPPDRQLKRTVDMRYRGQNYELSVDAPEGDFSGDALIALGRRFAQQHERRFGFAAPEDPIELVTFRLEACGPSPASASLPPFDQEPDASSAVASYRDVWFADPGVFVRTPIYDRDRLQPGDRFVGPAVIEQLDTTTLVPSGMSVHVDAHLNLLLEDL